MNRITFEVLRMIKENYPYDPLYYGQLLFRTEEEIQKAYQCLNKDGLILNGQITNEGEELLASKKIDNAIILAAGTSSRFVPLNFEKPKGLLLVKGEVLVERQIRQLKEKGINDIIIVVGHMKEQFEYLKNKYNVILVETNDYAVKNNHASVYAARKYLKNSIITSSDLYFSENIFQSYAFDAYYCVLYITGKTAERGIVTDDDDRIIETMYGDRCHDIWVTLGYAFFNKRFSDNYLEIMKAEFDLPQTAGKFWADIQDEHLDKLYMYAKYCADNVIYEFDSLEELKEFDLKYLYDSGSKILHEICHRLKVKENNIIGIETLKIVKNTMFRFRCKGETYICDVNSDDREKVHFQGRVYYKCNDFDNNSKGIRNLELFKMEKNIKLEGKKMINFEKELDQIFSLSKEFEEYHERALPLCAAENVISDFANLPLSFGFQERYIMNNTYSFNLDDNFIGCEKLFPFYEKLSEVCCRLFGAKYTDPRPFTGMQCLDMVVKTICKPGDRMMILGKEWGGHASVKPVTERLGIITFEAPYNLEEYDLDYDAVNKMIAEENISHILLAPSDLIKPLDVERIDTDNCVLLWDCSQLMGLIAAGLCPNPLKTKRNIVMFGGTHKTFPGPASGLIMTNDKYLHDLMETSINPKFLRHSQMHQKISLLFALLEFEKFGAAYMSHMVHCSNYLGKKLKEAGYDVADCNGVISKTHQIFIRCSKDEMDTIYDNAYKCEVTLNKKHKGLFYGYGIRLGTQEIARYDWNDAALDTVAEIITQLSNKEINVEHVKKLILTLPPKELHYAFGAEVVNRFKQLL